MIPTIIGFWWMVVGHFLADYPLQTEFVAQGKNPFATGQRVPWYYVMASHAFLHGGFVAVAACIALGELHALFAVTVGLLEAGLHYGIDVLKCADCTSIHGDQCLHLLCKLAWSAAVLMRVCDYPPWGSTAACLFAAFLGGLVFHVGYRGVHKDKCGRL